MFKKFFEKKREKDVMDLIKVRNALLSKIDKTGMMYEDSRIADLVEELEIVNFMIFEKVNKYNMNYWGLQEG